MANAARVPAERNLTSLEIAGFKSANSPVRVNFRDVTVLAGANSAGKSTIMQPLLLIKQTLEKPFDPGGLAIDGPLVSFTNADQFFSHSKAKSNLPIFSVSMASGTEFVELSYRRASSSGVEITSMKFGNSESNHCWEVAQKLEQSDKSIEKSPFIGASVRNFSATFGKTAEIVVSRDRVSLNASLIIGRDSKVSPDSRLTLVSPANGFENKIREMIYLPGLRGNPERLYVISAAGPRFPGSFNDYVASIIHRWGAAKDGKLRDLENHLRALGLTWRVTTRAVDDTRVEVHVGRLPTAAQGGARDTVNIADVGFGVSQTLPVLVALLAATPHQIVYIEQPELHLHPKAQIAMADILVQAADRGVRVIIETHSNLLLLALQSAVAEGRISPDRVSLNWFTRDATGQTQITEAQLDSDGSYGDWPEDFGEIELKLQDRFMTAVERHHAK